MFSVDTGFVFALRQEAVGVLDRMKRSQTTRGGGWTFHTGKIDGVSVALVISGVGQKNAEAAAKVLIDVFAPKSICSAGYAGGLSSRLKQSDICIPEQVIRASDRQVLDLSGSIPRTTLPMPNKLTLLTVNDAAVSPEQKRTWHEQTGAALVDMETFAVAEVCRVREIPFLSIRVILDAAEDRIPSDITKILAGLNKGTVRFSGTILGSLWSRPSMVLDLVSLKRRAFTATERLTLFTVAELFRQKPAEKNRERLNLLEQESMDKTG